MTILIFGFLSSGLTRESCDENLSDGQIVAEHCLSIAKIILNHLDIIDFEVFWEDNFTTLDFFGHIEEHVLRLVDLPHEWP